MIARALGEARQLLARCHAPTLGRKSRTEHETNVTQRPLIADRARCRGRAGVVASDPQQFELSIADILPIELAGPECPQRASTIEAIVDGSGSVTRATGTLSLRKQHPCRLPITPGLSHRGPPRRRSRYIPVRDGAIGQSGQVGERPGTSSSAKRPRHPSAGNLDAVPMLVDDDSAPALSPLAYPNGARFDPTVVHVGPGLSDEAVGRLVGGGEGRRILELGCGNGSNAVALARQGARVIVVDSSATRLAAARARADDNGVRIELHHGDLADLAFVRADQIDVCLAAYSLSEVADVARVFRQVHRVLRTEAPMVVSLPHPLAIIADGDPDKDGVRLSRSSFDRTRVAADGAPSPIEPHRITDIFTAFTRSNFRVDVLLEPQVEPSADPAFALPAHAWIPPTLVIRGRKQGI